MRPSLISLVASASTASAAFQGFNYGATKSDGSFMFQADYESKFNNARNLVGTSGFTSARLYTTIQGGSYTNEPTEAIPAAIATDTSLLLGLWASGGEGGFQAEITALKAAIAKYGEEFTKRVVGISVGSEDLYRISPVGVAALSGYGANPDELVKYIGELRSALQGTPLSGASIGHVDTWTAWANSSNSAVASAVDWIGFDAYPYFQNSQENGIEQGKALFDEALATTKAATQGKPVWITETGWPVSGKTENKGVPSLANAETYWKEVGCPLFGNVNTWWYTQQDADPVTPNPSFGLVGTITSTTPLYDLSCDDVSSSSSSSSAVAQSSTAGASSTVVPSSSAAASTSAVATTAGGEGAATSALAGETTFASSVISSISTAATGGAIVSSGGQLGPSQVIPTFFSTTAVPTGSAGSTATGSGNGTTVATPTLSSNAGSNPTSSDLPTISGNAAAGLSGSLAGVVLAAAFAVL